MTVKLRNVSNPAALAVEWQADGTTYQLVNMRYTSSLMFGMRHEDDVRWTTTPVVKPERFGMTGIPRNAREFLVIANRFVNGS